ncbi:MAG TPA: LON peptidase substrate-binding domain-containing protein [Thermoanaerobaculia bacterium]|nr:LON peptidase substrate-binding domain-containing protein [Thermoanaerobaculia bacterium]
MNSEPRIADLPATILLLPLAPWLLLPETMLPVAITAPEGRAVIDAALAADGWVGVVQARDDESRDPARRFYPVGCLARIHEESRGGDALHVRLEGVVRFRLRVELPPAGGLSRGDVEYGEFAGDLRRGEEEAEDLKLELFKDRILELGRQQFGSAGALETMSPRQIILFMAQTAPLAPIEKQALLEARDFRALLDTLGQLFALNYLTTTPDTTPPSRVN